MTKKQSALSRTFFIGGPQRIGKSYVANALSAKINGHVVSTDSIADAVKAVTSDTDSDLFLIQNTLANLPEQEWIRAYAQSPDFVIDVQRRATRAFWPAVAEFCESFESDTFTHIVEGVIIQPAHLALLPERPRHAVFFGNTSETHAEAMFHHAWTSEHDWMRTRGYSKERVYAMAIFVREFSLYFKREQRRMDFCT